MTRTLFFLFLMIGLGLKAQTGGKLPGLKSKGNIKEMANDSLKKNKRRKKKEVHYPVSQYKISFLEKDSIYVDTVLDIRNLYKLNYLLKDDFELLPFQNMGQGFNYLAPVFLDKLSSLEPGFVASAKDFHLWKPGDIPFFKVPTTYSDLFYLSGISQGQMLRSLITSNINPQINFALGYQGINSLGLYKNSKTGLGRFFFSLDLYGKNKKYHSKLFYVSHNLMNEENGGIKDPAQFESGDPAFTNRSRIEVNLTDAEINTYSNTFYWQQSYKFFDSIPVILQNETQLDNKKYIYSQNSPSDFIGTAFTTGEILDSTRLKHFENYLSVKFNYRKIKLQSGLSYIYNGYKWDSIKNIGGKQIPNELLYNDMAWKSSLAWKNKKLDLNIKTEIIPTTYLKAYLLQGKLKYKKDSLKDLTLQFVSSSRKPDFKYILFQSAYEQLNWYHPEFDNVQYNKVSALFTHHKYGSLLFKQEAVNNYTFFDKNLQPRQYSGLISISSLKFQNDLRFGKWGIASDFLYQKVIKGEEILSLPDFIIRESFYFSNRYFKRNLHIQTGFTIKYFPSYYAMGYHPVLGDFYIQHQQKTGGFPLLDLFFNFKVKRFRFYLKAEHLNAIWEKSGASYYTAPGYPMRDFNLRFGINWIFFN